MGKKLGGEPKGYSIPYDIILSNKNWETVFFSKVATACRLSGH